MPYSGAIYTPPASSWSPAVSGTPISSSDWNALLADLTGAFNSVPPYAIVQAGAMNFGGIAGGTANALTLSLSPALPAYSNGLNIRFLSGAAANTTAATISVNGLAATAVQLGGAALTGGEIQANRIYEVVYYNTVFHLFQPSAQAPLTLSSTAAGTLLTLSSTDAGAAVGPIILTDRASASPAASDLIGQLVLRGRDSGGNATDYADFFASITDPTDGSEDGRFTLRTLRAGAAQSWRWESGVQYFSTLAMPSNTGEINATGLYVNGHGTVAQRVNDIEATLVTSANNIPFDDTIPQQGGTEGVEVLSVAITPTNAASVLYIDVAVQVGLSTTNTVTAALFVDATAAAIDAMGESVDATTIRTIKYTHIVSAASTSARTYRVRVGGASGTVSLNGINGASRRYGGVTQSTLTVTEILPQ